MEKTKLGLNLPTDPRWVNLAEMDLSEILTDHAYCEQKATTACISLIQQYPDKVELVRELSPVVAEEWSHFQAVLEKLNERNLALGRQRKDEYVNALLVFQAKGGSREDRLLEKLLTCALIEARSCERFRLLSIHIKDPELREFYREFMVSEAGHYRMFLQLARLYFEESLVAKRWTEYLVHEAKVLSAMKPRGDRMH